MAGIASRNNEILGRLGFNENLTRDFISKNIDWTELDGNPATPDNNANNRQTFAQASAPTINYNPGDIWFDTDDNNHPYQANSSYTWVSMRDAGASPTPTGSNGWSSDLVFSATDYRVVAWATGTLTLANSTAYSITGANTGNMAALTYIYLDTDTSSTALQTTTTASTAVGTNKLLVAVAKNNSDTSSKASFQVFGGGGGNGIFVDFIAANSASTNEFVSNTAQIKNLIVTDAKINDLAVDKLTAGSITSKAITLAVAAGTGDTYIGAGKTDFTNTDNGFILGIDDSDSDLSKFYIGDSSYYLNWTGAALNVNGAAISSPTITSIQAGTEIAIQGWQYDGAFSATDYRVVAWASGTLTLLDGTTYNITGANTGNMAALTYIYLAIGTSTTLFQTSTTAGDAVGTGKILIAVAQNNSDTSSQATFQVFGGIGGQLLAVDNIAANSASTNEFVSNTAQIANLIVTDAKINDLAVSKLTAGSITSKAITLAVSAGTGDVKIQAGKTDFGDTTAGFILGIDDSVAGDPAKFEIGDASNSLTWDGSTLSITGSVTATTGTIGGWTIGANSILAGSGAAIVALDSTVTAGDDIRIYAGSATPATAPFKVTEAGALTATTATITGAITAAAGSVIATSYLSGAVALSNTNIAAQGWTSDLVFSSTDYDTIAWASGTITTAAGTAYSIDAGNTGNMAATTYIYLDIATSITVLQTTTTATTANGSGKIHIATATLNADATSDALYQTFGGIGGQIVLVDNISANSASTNEFVSNTAQIANLVVTDAKINTLGVAKLTAGTITSKAITLAVSAGTGDTKIQAGMTDFGDAVNSGFILGIDDSDSDLAKFYIGNGADSSKLMYWDGANLVVNNSTISNQNIFGDGDDGNVTSSGDITLTTDMYYDDLTITNGDTLYTAGYRVFVKGTLTNNGTISRAGNAGSNATNGAAGSSTGNAAGGTGGVGGAALAETFLKGSEDGKTGGDGGYGGIGEAGLPEVGDNGVNGDNLANGLGVDGGDGTSGGKGGSGRISGGAEGKGAAGGTGGTGGTLTAATTIARNLTELSIMRNFEPATPTKYEASAGTASGGGGGGGRGNYLNWGGGGGGGAGGSGGSGSLMLICAKVIINSATGVITTEGGDGGDGGDGGGGFSDTTGGGGGGSGGTGGSGGVLAMFYQSLTNSGSITVAGGTGGTGGTGGQYYFGTPPVAGSNGDTGNTGTLIQFEV
uniref:Uncharacterized protein n=1 Tax=viral metagenome TaxID=1070528 RepID=A0A6M3KAR4_9ZZZZ